MTDNITLPRQTVQQALEALLLPSMKTQQMLIQRDEAIIALRRALAEPEQEPVAWMHPMDFGRDAHVTGKQVSDEQLPLYTTPPQQQAEPVAGNTLLKTFLASAKEAGVTHLQQAEPVGWLDGNDKLAEFMHRDLKADHDKRGSATPREFTVPVYTAPPQRKPLTDAELDALAIDEDGLPNSHLEFARAIEASHGIGEKK